MIWGQIAWGLLLSGALGYSFHRAWKWEHGTEAHVLFSEKNGKETFVFLPPTGLFWILLAFLVTFIWHFGIQKGLSHFAALAFDVILLLSAYYVLLLLLLPFLRRWFSARMCAVLWLVPAFLSWQANVLITIVPLPRQMIYLPRNVWPIIGFIWLSGFLLVLGRYLIPHLILRMRIRKRAMPESDPEICAA